MLPLSAAEFAALMAPLGPFEPRPLLAVAVSGGADSLALALLAGEWARSRGGEAVALTVDHGLRAGSDAEAAQVGRRLAAAGIPHHVLPWAGAKPDSDVQAQARAARYRLLRGWCGDHGALHLLVGHHRDDQAETLLLRLGRGSGVDGLAAMAAIEHMPEARLLRPLLTVPAARLRATLAAQGREWVEDPSNANPAFARVRLRRLAPLLAEEGLTAERLAATAGRLGRARAALEESVAEAAVRHVRPHPAGFALVERSAVAALPEEIGLRLLARLVQGVGGGRYVPRLERLERLWSEVRGADPAVFARTLAGCRLVGSRDGWLLVCREPARVAPPLALVPGEAVDWDGRFRLRLAADAPGNLGVAALGLQGWREIGRRLGRPAPDLPAASRPTLPVLFDQDGVCVVPHLGYNRDERCGRALDWIVPRVMNPITSGGRCLV